MKILQEFSLAVFLCITQTDKNDCFLIAINQNLPSNPQGTKVF
jgi:hypothetical protein